KPLEPEKSGNYSAGFVFHHGPFEATVDAYEIDVFNKIVLSETLTGSATGAVGSDPLTIFNLLQPFGPSAARFFTNGVDTRTQGIDYSISYRLPTDIGDFNLSASANQNMIKVTKVP